jgi:thioredoxin reductase (NADPH)
VRVTAPLDCLIIGGGPAGLTAAIYAARFRLSTRLVDAGASRAALIECSHNHAGFPDGVNGPELLARMRRQAENSGAELQQGAVERVEAVGDEFVARTMAGSVRARAVLLTTGVANRTPDMSPEVQSAALAAGRLRYCPVCDGAEITDQNVAVIGTGAHGVREALFLRTYTRTIILISPRARHALTSPQKAALAAAHIRRARGPVSDFVLDPEGLSFTHGASRGAFQCVYPAMGSVARSDIARALGAALSAQGCVKVDAHQRTNVPGLYAAGDVVIGLDQISHAMGEAGVAATTIRNDLAAKRPFFR